MSYTRFTHAPRSFSTALAALAYAAEVHAGQRRHVECCPFILHPLEVCCVLYHAGAPDHVIAAGVLHDTIEKAGANAAELGARFGTAVATLVLAVSEDQRIVRHYERKPSLGTGRAGWQRGHDDLRRRQDLKCSRAENRAATNTSTTRPWRRSRDRRLAHYRQRLQLLEENLIDSLLVLRLRAELAKSMLPAAVPAAAGPRQLDRAV